MVRRGQVDAIHSDKSAMSALMAAASNGSTAIVDLVLKAGAKVTAPLRPRVPRPRLSRGLPRHSSCPLPRLLFHGSLPLASPPLLPTRLAVGISIPPPHPPCLWHLHPSPPTGPRQVNLRNSDGVTALMHAAVLSHYEVVVQLLVVGADLRATDNDGFDALVAAATGGSAAVSKLLIEKGLDANVMAASGGAPLMIAAKAVT